MNQSITSTIETERLLLKAVQLEDAVDIYDYVRNPNVLRYTTGTPPKKFAETEAFVRGLADPSDNQFVWAIRLHKLSNVIGVVEFGLREATVGTVDYALAEPYWNQGIMSEAVRFVIDWAFQSHAALDSIISAAMIANQASTRVQQKCGMKAERTEFQTWSKFKEPVELSVCTIARIDWEEHRLEKY